MAVYLVSGAGDPTYDGLYVQTGTYNGHPAYVLQGSPKAIWADAIEWYISPSVGNTTDIQYENTGAFTSTPETSGWSVRSGASPAPTLTLQSDPVVSSFVPTSAGAGVGFEVDITGQYFSGATSVDFNGTPADFTVVSDTLITTTVPSGATTGTISITTPVGTGTSGSNFTVLALAAAFNFDVGGIGSPNFSGVSSAGLTIITPPVLVGYDHFDIVYSLFGEETSQFTLASDVAGSYSFARGEVGNKDYAYRVVAVKSDGTRDGSFELHRITQTAGANPTGSGNVEFINLPTTTTISPWGAYPTSYVNNADSFTLQRKVAGALDSTIVNANYSMGVAQSFTDTGLTPNTSYSYRFAAINAFGATYGPWFTTATLLPLPDAPSPPVVESTTSSSVTTDNAPSLTTNATSQTVGIRQTSLGGVYTEYSVTTGNPLTITGLSPNTEYDLVRIMRNSAGGTDSTITNFTTNTTAATPGTPGVVTFGTVTPTTILVQLPAFPSNTTSLTLQRAPDGSTWSSIATGQLSGASYNDTGLSAATTYYYRVIAVGPGGSTNGPSSSQSTAGVPSTPGQPLPPDVIDQEDTSVTLNPGALTANAVSLTLRISTDGTTFSDALTGIVAAGNQILGTLTASTQYWFLTRAVGATGLTADSTIVPVLTRATAAGGSAPTTPDAPTLVSKTPLSATIAQPAWPTGTTSMQLYRGGVLIYTYSASNTGPYTDTAVSTPNSYSYTCIAVNSTGSSAASSALTVSLASTATIAWVNPVASQTLSGVQPLVLNATFSGVPNPTLPVRVLVNGAPIPQQPTLLSGSQWRGSVDTRNFTYQGNVTLTAIARDSGGFDSAPATITVAVNNSLQTAIITSDYILPSAVSTEIANAAQRITKAILAKARLHILNDPGKLLKWFQFYFSSPEGTTLGDYTDVTAVLTDTAYMQGPLLLGQSFTVTGRGSSGGTITPSDSTSRMRVIETPATAVTNTWDTGDDTLIKGRFNSDGSIQIVTNNNLWKFTAASGLVGQVEFSAFSVSSVTDATLVGTKCYCISSGSLVIIDLTTGNVTLGETVAGESKTLTNLEALSATAAYVVFSSGGNTTCYQHVPGMANSLWTLAKTVTYAAAFNGNLYFATSDYGLYESVAGATPTLLYQHSATIDGVLPITLPGQTGGVVQFFDSDGNIYQVTLGAGAALVSTLGSLTAIATYQGNQASTVGAAAAGAVLWQQGGNSQSNSSVYAPFLAPTGALTIPVLMELVTTLIAAVGDPLNGGTPAVTDDSLITAYTTSGTVKVSRVQVAQIDKTTAYQGTDVRPMFWPCERQPVA